MRHVTAISISHTSRTVPSRSECADHIHDIISTTTIYDKSSYIAVIMIINIMLYSIDSGLYVHDIQRKRSACFDSVKAIRVTPHYTVISSRRFPSADCLRTSRTSCFPIRVLLKIVTFQNDCPDSITRSEFVHLKRQVRLLYSVHLKLTQKTHDLSLLKSK